MYPIRAVLIETTSESRGRRLMDLAQHPAVVGASERSGLFWFTISPMFTDPALVEKYGLRHALPAYLEKPEMTLSRVWALPDRSLHALTDAENSARARSE